MALDIKKSSGAVQSATTVEPNAELLGQQTESAQEFLRYFSPAQIVTAAQSAVESIIAAFLGTQIADEVNGAIATHKGEANPHSQYRTETQVDTSINQHLGSAPHLSQTQILNALIADGTLLTEAAADQLYLSLSVSTGETEFVDAVPVPTGTNTVTAEVSLVQLLSRDYKFIENRGVILITDVDIANSRITFQNISITATTIPANSRIYATGRPGLSAGTVTTNVGSVAIPPIGDLFAALLPVQDATNIPVPGYINLHGINGVAEVVSKASNNLQLRNTSLVGATSVANNTRISVSAKPGDAGTLNAAASITLEDTPTKPPTTASQRALRHADGGLIITGPNNGLDSPVLGEFLAEQGQPFPDGRDYGNQFIIRQPWNNYKYRWIWDNTGLDGNWVQEA